MSSNLSQRALNSQVPVLKGVVSKILGAFGLVRGESAGDETNVASQTVSLF